MKTYHCKWADTRNSPSVEVEAESPESAAAEFVNDKCDVCFVFQDGENIEDVLVDNLRYRINLYVDVKASRGKA